MRAHLDGMHELAKPLTLTEQWTKHEHDEENFPWDDTYKFAQQNGMNDLHTQWELFEATHDLHTLFVSHVSSLQGTDIDMFTAFSDTLSTVRLAVVSCALLECAVEPLEDGETRGATIRATRSGLTKCGLSIPAYMSKVLRHRQAQQ